MDFTGLLSTLSLSPYYDFLPFLLFLIVVLSVAFLVTSLIEVRKHQIKKITSCSTRYHTLMLINNRYSSLFDLSLKSLYVVIFSCSSKAQYDRLNLKEKALVRVENNIPFYQNYLKPYQKNAALLPRYTAEIDFLQTIPTVSMEELGHMCMSYRRILELEERLLKDSVLSPRTDVNIRFVASYTSPQGRKHYERSISYTLSEMESLISAGQQRSAQRANWQAQIKSERSKMSESLRYDVLRRDGYRCRICGATASDGVKLHVDHIIPVSKGGKTTLSNLQTLCERCNRGKSNKM